MKYTGLFLRMSADTPFLPPAFMLGCDGLRGLVIRTTHLQPRGVLLLPRQKLLKKVVVGAHARLVQRARGVRLQARQGLAPQPR